MAKKRKTTNISKKLLLICIITGITVLVMNILNRRLQLAELSEITGYVGTAFVISLVILIGIVLFNQAKK